MRLASVRALKEELSSSSLPPLLENTAIAAYRVGGERRMSARRTGPPIALGVAPGKGPGDYKLAVRVQQEPGVTARALAPLPAKIAALAQGEADVRIVSKIKKRALPPWHQRRTRPLTIGSSIGHFAITAGTLGAFVKCSETKEICILSNNHVLADEGRGKRGDDVLQQGAIDGGMRPASRVASLGRFVRFGPRGIHYVDAAIAPLDDEMEYYADHMRSSPASTLSGARASTIEPDDEVWKVGRTTGYTRGIVTAIELDEVWVGFDIGDVRFDDQIEIENPRGPFSAGGDSGSLIVDTDGKACALLFAGGRDASGRDLTYANPIKSVFEALNVTLAL